LGALLEVCEALGLARLDNLQAVATALVEGAVIERSRVVQGEIAATSIKVSERRAPHRQWSGIRRMIEDAAAQGVLSASATALAISTFESIAIAEAEVHNEPIELVHFHEVGAADSIIDIVCSCYLFDLLAPSAVYASPLVLGFGTFKAAHGLMSVPAPATALLIKGLSVTAGPHEGEMTTPTGAALAAAFVTHWQPFVALRPIAIGYGAGTRTVTGASNTVRLLVGETAGQPITSTQQAFTLENVTLIEANIDHRTPEALAFAAEELLAAGALDVWQEPITMKKGRMACKLALLCQPNRSGEFAQLFLALTGSLGLRMRTVERVVLPRQELVLDTQWGPVRFKQGRFFEYELPDMQDRSTKDAPASPLNNTRWIRPEHDDVARLAREHDLDYQSLYDQLMLLVDGV